MVRLMFGAAPIAALLAAGATDGAPRTLRYKIDSKTEQVVDLTGAGGPKQEVNMNQMTLVTVTLTDSAGGKVMHVVIDSITSDAQVPEVAAAIGTAKGAWIHGFLDAWGRGTVSASSADNNEIVSQLKPMMARFFPVLKPGAKQGDSWVDTVVVDSKSPTRAMKTTRVANFTHAGTATWGGGSAVRLDAASAASGAGTIENPMAGTMEMETTATGTEAFYMASDGTYVGGESITNMSGKIRAAMLPDAIPLTSKSTTTVTLLK